MSITYSVIIPAYNEAAFLPATLVALQAAMAGVAEAGEIIVVDNNSTDNTADIARAQGAVCVFEAENRISRARNAGARVARGKYLVFLDADTTINAGLLRTALANLATGRCCGGGARVCMERPVGALPTLVLKTWNSLSRHLQLAAGCFVYCLREGFEAVGGFSEAVYASEEIWLSRSLAAWGKKRDMDFRIIRATPILTSGRKLDWYSQGRLVLFFLPVLLFPPLLRVQYFCNSWYRRPPGHN